MNVKSHNERITICYCRVFSYKQKDDLERQVDNVRMYLIAKGQPFEIISDIGSGINYKKKELQDLIKRISQNQVEKVVVFGGKFIPDTELRKEFTRHRNTHEYPLTVYIGGLAWW